MSIWHKPVSVKELQCLIENTLAETIGIELTEITDDSLKCRMEVNNTPPQRINSENLIFIIILQSFMIAF